MKRKVLFCSFEEQEEKRNCERIKMKIRYLNKCHSEEELIITVQIACKSLTYNKTRKKSSFTGSISHKRNYSINKTSNFHRNQCTLSLRSLSLSSGSCDFRRSNNFVNFTLASSAVGSRTSSRCLGSVIFFFLLNG